MSTTPGPLRLGLSACFLHADPERKIFKGKTLLYAEESMLRFIMSAGALPVLLPRASGMFTATDLVAAVDGMILQGGSDLSPSSYGEEPIRPEWSGDKPRDEYEMELIRACVQLDKPVLGICRGLQIINVCFGGSLYQDIPTLHPKGMIHRDGEIYDQLFHDLELTDGGSLSRLYDGARTARINSVHHQGIKRLGEGLQVEAVSPHDELIEAIRLKGDAFVMGVQWHPEFQDQNDQTLLSPRTLLSGFLDEVRRRRQKTSD
jgi:putative glutamine amidotransferase